MFFQPAHFEFFFPVFYFHVYSNIIVNDFKVVEEVERALLDCMPSDQQTPFLQDIISPQRIIHKNSLIMFLRSLRGFQS